MYNGGGRGRGKEFVCKDPHWKRKPEWKLVASSPVVFFPLNHSLLHLMQWLGIIERLVSLLLRVFRRRSVASPTSASKGNSPRPFTSQTGTPWDNEPQSNSISFRLGSSQEMPRQPTSSRPRTRSTLSLRQLVTVPPTIEPPNS